jgi:hypothetical protein
MRTLTEREWIARVLAIVGASGLALAGCDHEESGNADASVAQDLKTVDQAQPNNDAGPSVRRPFLVGSSLRSAAPIASADWRDVLPPVQLADQITREALAAAWLKDALEEHASVAAFARFAVLSLSVGAPAEIVAAAQRASLDEIRHARACFGLAERYGAGPRGPGPLDVSGAFGEHDLRSLGLLTAHEGCVGETLGALLASRQAAMASDPVVADIMERIARDERRHAELAWQFVRWAVERAPSLRGEVVAAIGHASDATLAAPLRSFAGDLVLWHAHGRLTCDEARQVASHGIDALVRPALVGLWGIAAGPEVHAPV